MLLVPLALVVSAPAQEPTGVLIDAAALAIKRARFPRVYDEDGQMLYPTPALMRNDAYTGDGFRGYKPCVTDAKEDKARLGASPLVIKALKLRPKNQDPYQASVVVGKDDAAKLREVNTKLKLLDKDKFCISIGLAVLKTEPAADAKDVAGNVTVKLWFSKPLSDASIESRTLITCSDEKGSAVPGKLTYDRDEQCISFQPSSPWAKGTKYTVKVAREIESDGRGCLDGPFTLSFATPAGDKDGAAGAGDKPAAGKDGG
jgi:hypothetical protein